MKYIFFSKIDIKYELIFLLLRNLRVLSCYLLSKISANKW